MRAVAGGQAEPEGVRPGLGQGVRRIAGGDRIPHVDVCDAGPDHQATRRSEKHSSLCEGLAPQSLAEPASAETKVLHLGGKRSDAGRSEPLADEDADRPRVDRTELAGQHLKGIMIEEIAAHTRSTWQWTSPPSTTSICRPTR